MGSCLASDSLTDEQWQGFKQDLTFYLDKVESDYAYLEQKQTNWDKVRQLAWQQFPQVNNRRDFITLLERLQIELYDNHVQLLNSTPSSPKLIPSSTDIYAEFRQGTAKVVNLMPNTPAFEALQIGDEILTIDHQPVIKALGQFVGSSFDKPNDEIRSWALNVALAGKRGHERHYEILRDGKKLKLTLAEAKFLNYDSPLEIKRLNDIGYIRFNNSLGDNSVLKAFPKALSEFMDTNGLILDLRQTQGGGNSLIGRAILGHFVTQDHFYQKHESPYDFRDHGIKRSWLEIASPLEPYYAKPVAVLVNQWTGSMGEGLALGFDAMDNATVVGTPMAKLLGAMWDYRLPNSDIGFKLATEKMYHVNGTPREQYKPQIPVIITTTEEDEILAQALLHLQNKQDEQ